MNLMYEDQPIDRSLTVNESITDSALGFGAWSHGEELTDNAFPRAARNYVVSFC
jgi:hypothetical protein